MAKSGSSRTTIASRLYLDLEWQTIIQEVSNNRSKVKLTLKLVHDGTGIWFSANKTGNLHGSSFTYTGGFSGTGTKTLSTREVWVNHNSDGTKSQTFNASFNIAITYAGAYRGNQSVSTTANLDAIPRASTMSAFSFGAHLKNGVANSINYTVDRKSGNFRHQIQLRDGNTTVWTWDNQNTDGSNTIALTASNVNTLLNRMSTVTSKTFTLRVATRSGVGGGFIGSAVSRTATATVHADVKPSAGTVALSQTGNSVSSHYLQNKSKVKASFTGSAGYGATISNSQILVRRKTSNNDAQYISSFSGTTAKAVSLSGTYQVEGSITDSRGRKGWTLWAEFEVTPYSSPKITNFTAVRSSSTPTTVSISRAGTHTPLGGSNVLTYTVQRRIGTGAWTNVDTNATGTSTTDSFSGTSTSTGNDVTSSYDFRMVVTDKFGESAESVVSVSTQRVVLDIHKNEGVGIGKIHERGVLDVDGDAYFGGNMLATGGVFSEPVRFGGGIDSVYILPNSDLNDIQTAGFYHNPMNSEASTILNTPLGSAFSLLVEKHAGAKQIFTRYETSRVDAGRSWVRNYYSGTWSEWKETTTNFGSNAQGQWIRFGDGLQVCWTHKYRSITVNQAESGTAYRRTNQLTWDYPMAFVGSTPSVHISTQINTEFPFFAYVNTAGLEKVVYRVAHISTLSFNNMNAYMHKYAIGRWKW